MRERIWAPGRVNLIGEHIDYHGLPVLPMALHRRVRITFSPRSDRRIRAVSEGPFGPREFEWMRDLVPAQPGDWENYLRAAAQAVSGKWGVGFGVDARITSDIPPAAGLSSSSALIVAFTLCLLRANGWTASFEDLMDILPEGEQFVGTRGGGMDHAAALASKEGYASMVSFTPLGVRHIPVPPEWGFLVAHSLRNAEKSGAARERFNAVRKGLPGSALHVTTEAQRVLDAVVAMERSDAAAFGNLLLESHASLRDRLRVSCDDLDRLVDAAMQSGALGARLTGAGFGGCVVVFCPKPALPGVRRKLIEGHYAGRPDFDPSLHLIDAEPGPGALCSQKQ